MSCVVDPALPARCTADPVRLRQILFNLLGNAIKFTGSGAIALSVRVSEQTSGCCMVRCEISDSGIGIRPDAMTMLFRPFTQADGSVRREYGGSGLGLSICKKLVELMDGSIGVESALGRGSTFWFELPLAVACGGADMPAGAAPAPVTASPARHGQPDAHAPILLVEDNQMNQIVAVRQLQLCGYSVDVVHNGQEALAAMKARSYALVLMDCQMPVMDGWETTRRIRQAEAAGTPRVQIVAMTANAMRGDRERCLEAGMDDYIAKPIMRDQLAAMLRRRLLGGTAPPSCIAPASMDAGPRG